MAFEHPRSGHFLFGILTVALCARLAAAVWFTPPPISDGLDYVAIARSLARGEGYTLEGVSTAYRPPGYPLLLASSFTLLGESLTPVRLAQAFADVLSCLLVFSLGRKLFTERAGLIAAGIFAVFPIQIMYVSIMMTETVFTALLLLYLWLCVDRERIYLKALCAGAVLGVGTLVRPSMLLLPAVVLFIRWRDGWRHQDNLRSLAITGLAAFLVFSPWLVRNYQQFGRVSLTSNTGVNFWMGSHHAATGSYSFPNDNPLVQVGDEFKRSDLGIELGTQFILEHPLEYGGILAKKWAHFFSVDYWLLLSMHFDPEYRSAPNAATVFSRFPLGSILTVHVPFAIVLLLATFAFVCRADRDTGSILFVLTPCLYWLIVHLAFYANARYRFPIVPLLMIAAACGLDMLLRKRYRWTGGRALLFSLFVLLFVGGWTAERVLILKKARETNDTRISLPQRPDPFLILAITPSRLFTTDSTSSTLFDLPNENLIVAFAVPVSRPIARST